MRALAGEQRHAKRADHAVVGRHDDLLAEDLAEGRGYGVVVGGAALEEDAVADRALAHETVQVVGGDREGKPPHQVFAARTALLIRHHVALHEHGAALPQPDGRVGAQSHLRELVDDVDAELLGLLLEERAGARGAGLVHGEVDDDAVLQADELGVLAADLEDRVDLTADLAADEVGARLVGGDLVGDDVGTAELADELAAGACGADAQKVDARTDLGVDVGEALGDHFHGPRVCLCVDLLDDAALVVDHHEVRGDRTDVDAQIGVDDAAVGAVVERLSHVAEQDDLVHAERLGDREIGGRQTAGIERPQAGARVLVVGLDEGGADGAQRRVELRHEELALLKVERLPQRLYGASVGRHPADKRDGRLHDLALGDRALEIAHHGVAEAAQDLGGLVPLLLGVDHVRLGEHAAAAGDARRLAGIEDDVADVLDIVEEAARLLVHEGAGAGGAVAVGLVVGDTGAARALAGLQADELGRLAAHLEDGLRVRVQRGDAARDGLELVLEARLEGTPDEPAAGAGDAHAGDPALGQHGQDRVEQGLGGLGGAAHDARVAGHEDRSALGHREALVRGLEEVGVSGEQIGVQSVVVGLPGERRFEADAADIDTE